MALAITPDLVNSNVVGSKRQVPFTAVPDSSYPLGGEAVTAAQFGLVVLERIIWEGPAVDPDTTDNAVLVKYDKTAKTVQFFWDNEAGSNGPFVEVDATTNLSAYTAHGIAIGY